MSGAEAGRLADQHSGRQPWYRWGPYLSERQWGTVRERLQSLFLPDGDGRRPAFGADPAAADPLWRDHILFYEYFHGDTGAGLGASHQTGWTALVAKRLEQTGGRDQTTTAEMVGGGGAPMRTGVA